ncbi:MAG: FkbM family methyltransferase [Acidimicrobiia bacterium]
MLTAAPRLVRSFIAKRRAIGTRGVIEFAVALARAETKKPGIGHISVKGLSEPVGYRRGSSDLYVFRQIFLEQEYRPIVEAMRRQHVDLVVDCGANVGYASLYLLRAFPTARVVAIEPADGNFAVLEQNLRRFGERCRLVKAGVWSHKCTLILSDDFRDGREWSLQVREVPPGTPGSFDSVDIPWVLRTMGATRISILKVDIEGAETALFADPNSAWISAVDAIAMEVHHDTPFGDAGAICRAALQGFVLVSIGDGLFGVRPTMQTQTQEA